MNREQIMEAMNHIDPTYIEEADRPMPETRRVRWSRPAIIAACLCIVLAGTALAMELSGTRITGIFQDTEHPHYTYESDIFLYPVSGFSEELLELAETQAAAGETQFSCLFYTSEEMKEFLGINFADNPMLGAAGQETSVGAEEAVDGWTTHVLTADCVEAGPTRIECQENYQLGDVLISTTALLYTELMQDIPENYLYTAQANYCAHTELSLEGRYTAPSGLEAEIIRADASDTVHAAEPLGNVQYTAQFHMNGIQYSISALASDVENTNDTHVLAILKEVLDGFEYAPIE